MNRTHRVNWIVHRAWMGGYDSIGTVEIQQIGQIVKYGRCVLYITDHHR